jgi:alpha-beta hydrolase superfamily lysophospholipase
MRKVLGWARAHSTRTCAAALVAALVLAHWVRAHPGRSFTAALVMGFLLLNVLAYRHAHAMTHFVQGGGCKGKPEALPLTSRARLLVSGVAMRRPYQDGRPSDLGLDYQVHTFAGEAGDLEAWYVPHAAARGVVVLFHGFAGCKASLLPEARALHLLGYSCFLVDFRGCGGSGGDGTTIGYREADDVAWAVAHVREKWPGRPVVLFGQSMGSAAVLRAVGVLGVEADAAVLECPFDRLLTTVQMRFTALGVPAFPGAQLLVFWGGLQHGFNGFRHNPVDDARGVTCPVLLLHGRKDLRVSVAHAEGIRDNLAGEKVLYVFEGLGHESYVAQRPDEWKGEVGRFLERSLGR